MTLPISRGPRGLPVALAGMVALAAMLAQVAQCISDGRRMDTRELVLRDGEGNVRLRATADGDEVKIVFDGNRGTFLSIGVDRDAVKIYGRADQSDAAIEVSSGRAASYVEASYVEASNRKDRDERARTTLGEYGVFSIGDRGFIEMNLEEHGPFLSGRRLGGRTGFALGTFTDRAMRFDLSGPSSKFEAWSLDRAWLTLTHRERGDLGREVALRVDRDRSSLRFSDDGWRSAISLSDGDEGDVKLISGPKGWMRIARHPDTLAQ